MKQKPCIGDMVYHYCGRCKRGGILAQVTFLKRDAEGDYITAKELFTDETDGHNNYNYDEVSLVVSPARLLGVKD